MTVGELAKQPDFAAVNLPCADCEILGGYAGDLLSWVMGRACEDNAWITIMSNSNIVAVATLADVSCIILAEGVKPDEGVTEIALSKGINILSSEDSAYGVARMLSLSGL